MTLDSTPARDAGGPQLHGWKAISAYFGRSVRTVQRWERDFGLPVRRYGLGRSEVVHATVEDFERWRTSSEAAAAARSASTDPDKSAPPAVDVASTGAGTTWAGSDGARPDRRFRLRFAPAGLMLVAVVAALPIVATALAAWRWQLPRLGPRDDRARTEVDGAASSEPANWSVAGDTLVVTSADGEVLWKHRFPEQLTYLPKAVDGPSIGLNLVMVDMDGDGHREVVFRAIPADVRKDAFRFYGFTHSGRLLWTFAQGGTQVFGDTSYSAPFPADRIFATPRDGRGFDVWLVSVHNPWFPSSVSRIDADGTISAEYWSNGYISLIRGATVGGRRVVLVGARNNESEGASVAMLDASAPSGSAPAELSQYQCRTCPPGRPLRFVKIPKPARLRPLRGTSPVVAIDVDASSRIVVKIGHTFDANQTGGVVVYTFDTELRPLSVGLYDGYDLACRALARSGAIPPLPKTPAADEVRTIRWWDGTRFMDLTAPARAPGPDPLR